MNDYTDVKEWAEAGRALARKADRNTWDIADWLLTAERHGLDSKYKLACLILNFAKGTCRNYASTANAFPFADRNVDITFSHYAAVLPLSVPKRQRLLALAAERKLPVTKLRTQVRGLQRIADNARDAIRYPPGVYRVMLVDCPWQYRPDDATFRRGDGASADHYKTMSLERLCNMKLPRLTEDAVLFLWATVPLLPEALKVMEAWEFKYKSHFIWDKLLPNLGIYNQVNHELLLIGTRGACTPDSTKLFNSVVRIERTEHSRKPEYFRELIDRMYPAGNRIELFSRGKSPAHWAGWGDEYDPEPLVSAEQVDAYIRDAASK